MKTVRNIVYTAIVLSLVSFFAATHVGAKTTDFYVGEKAGMAQVTKDAKNEQCSLRFSNIDHEAKVASAEHVERLVSEGKSMDYVEGFRSGYERKWKLYLDVNCTP